MTQALVAAVCDTPLVANLPTPLLTAGCHILLFDGGSRGNPGAGGYGAIIVRIIPGQAPEVRWAQAGFLSDRRTTNNQAELQGLTAGLHQLTKERPTSAVVIGDSQLVLNAMRHHRPLKHPGLARLYQTARATADRLCVRGWYHHLRHHNRTADALANKAMDDRSSTTWHASRGRPTLTFAPGLPGAEYLDNDLDPWLEAHAPLLVYSQASDTSGRHPDPA